MILTKNEEVYHPISSEIPDTDIRAKLLPYAGKLVKITGHVYAWLEGDHTRARRRSEQLSRAEICQGGERSGFHPLHIIGVVSGASG